MKVNKQIAALVLTGVLAAGSALPAFAAAAPDGYTDASATPAAANGAYAAWQERWETMKNDWTQVSLSPGSGQTKEEPGTDQIPKFGKRWQVSSR